jgi:hypothetical protein
VPCHDTQRAGSSAAPDRIACTSIGAPATSCSTFGNSDFILVPLPSGKNNQRGRVIWHFSFLLRPCLSRVEAAQGRDRSKLIAHVSGCDSGARKRAEPCSASRKGKGRACATVVFDLDGTLADTSGDLIAAANACFRAMGHAGAA